MRWRVDEDRRVNSGRSGRRPPPIMLLTDFDNAVSGWRETPEREEHSMGATAGHEVRMLVDGELIEADSGKTFDNVNPATEEVLGPVADASAAEMHRAIDGARRAFDETDWSTNKARRAACLSQLQEALEKEREELREELILEVGCPRMTTQANQLDIPLTGCAALPDQAHRRIRVAHQHGRGRRPAGHPTHAPGLEGAGGCRRRHRAVELPGRGHPQQARPGAGHRQHRDPEAGARHAVERDEAGTPGGGADGLPGGRAERGDVVGPFRRGGTRRCRPRST